MIANGLGLLLGGNEKVLKLVLIVQLHECTKPTLLYTLEG